MSAHLNSTIAKTLSSNDTGETGTHQAGILVPKDPQILSYFPFLDFALKNPRSEMLFRDAAGAIWKFVFVYYNNKRFGGTRDEFRLTGMTSFIRSNNLKAGDTLLFSRHSDDDTRLLEYSRLRETNRSVIKLSGTWKVIEA